MEKDGRHSTGIKRANICTRHLHLPCFNLLTHPFGEIKQKVMGGLARLCKMYGQIDVTDANGKKVIWVWDYANDKPRLKSEMTKDEIKASEIAKWTHLRVLGEILNNKK